MNDSDVRDSANIIWYNCTERLNERHDFERSCRLHHRIPTSTFESYDLFAICDAVLKRGLSGFAEVEERKRWREILDSLCHYSYSLDSIKRVYMDHLQQYENRLRKDEHLSEKYILKEPAVERFYVPPCYLTGHLEHLLGNRPYRSEEALMQQLSIRFIDEYLALRSVALTGKFVMTKLPKDLMEKYAAICKFLLIGSSLSFSQVDQRLLQFLKMTDRTSPKKVLIIGDTFCNARLAEKLSHFNFEVTLLETLPDGSSFGKHEGLEHWPLLSQLGSQDYFVKELQSLGVEPKLLPESTVKMFDSKYEEYSLIDVKSTERLLFEQLAKARKGSSSTNLREAIEERLDLQMTTSLHRELTIFHLNRLLMVDVLLGDQTELKTLEKHLARGLPENLCVQPQIYYARDGPSYSQVKSVLLEKISTNRVRFMTPPSCSVQIRDNQVFLTTPQAKRTFDYLVYGLVDNVIKAAHQKNFKIPEFSGEYLTNSYYVLRSVRFEQYVHREIVLEGGDSSHFREHMDDSCWVRSETLGCVFLHLLHIPHNRQYNSKISFFVEYRKSRGEDEEHERDLEEILNIINKVYLRQTSYSMKQLTPINRRDSSNLILKESEQERWKNNVLEMRMRLYFNVPITTGKYSSRLADFMAAGDFILNSILANTYKLKEYDQEVYQAQMSEDTVIIRKVNKDPRLDQKPVAIYESIPVFGGRSISAPQMRSLQPDQKELPKKLVEKSSSKEQLEPKPTRSISPQQEALPLVKVASSIFPHSSSSQESSFKEQKRQTSALESHHVVSQPFCNPPANIIPTPPQTAVPAPTIAPIAKEILPPGQKLSHLEVETQTTNEFAFINLPENNNMQPMSKEIEPVREAIQEKSAEWYFGLNHELVTNHCEFFKRETMHGGWVNAIEQGQLLQPLSPVPIDNIRSIWSLGQPYLPKLKPSLEKLIEGYEELEYSAIPEKFVSRRIGVSVFDSNRLTHYYQTTLFNEQMDVLMYVVVDQLYPSIVLYHSNLERLISSINKRIEHNNAHAKGAEREPERLPSHSNRNFLFPAVLKRTIASELKHIKFMDTLLDAKLAKEGDQVTRPSYYSSKVEYLCEELKEIMNDQAYIRGMRKLNIFQLLIGQYDPRVILLKRAPKDWKARAAVSDGTYLRNLKQLDQKDPINDRFRVELLEMTSCSFRIKRRFLSLQEPDEEGVLAYTCEKRSKPPASRSKQRNTADKDEFSYCIGEGIYRAEFQDMNLCLDSILNKLLDHFPVRHILQYFREFVANELEKHTKLPPMLKQLYLVEMGRKKIPRLNLGVLNVEELEPSKKDELATAINGGEICFIEGIPFLAF